jgi:protein transport protein SEC61 subunit gamma-like protein
MSDQISEFMDIPREFIKDGTQFINRCTKPDRREFIKISQAVGVGFLVMGAVGYVVKLIHIPVNNILVGGA